MKKTRPLFATVLFAQKAPLKFLFPNSIVLLRYFFSNVQQSILFSFNAILEFYPRLGPIFQFTRFVPNFFRVHLRRHNEVYMMQHPKVVFIGFDGGDKNLILKWANAGILPAIQSLLARGLTGPTTLLPGFFIGATWPCFSTGVTPAKHGIHASTQILPGTYDTYRAIAPDLTKREPFWNHLSREGKRVVVLDIPLAGPSQGLNGIQLAEWGGHDTQGDFRTWPPELAKEVLSRFGLHPTRGKCDRVRGAPEYAEFRQELLTGLATKVSLTKYFLTEKAWDFFAQVFTEGHCVGHQCWHIHDSSHPFYDKQVRQSLGDPIKDIYVATDKAIGQLLKEIPDEAIIIFLVSHGMESRNVYFHLNDILLQFKVAVPPTKTFTEAMLSWFHKHLPKKVRERLRPVQHYYRTKVPYPPHVNREASKCFVVHDNGAVGSIRINLVGREPKGLIKSGIEYDDFCRELTKDLMAIKNSINGKPIIKQVIKTAQLYQGEYLSHLPDLLVEWNNETPISSIRSEKIRKTPPSFWHSRTGGHNSEGLFIAAGPSIKQGVLNRTVSILDFAPTIAELFGTKLPESDGQPIVEVLREIQPSTGCRETSTSAKS